MNGDLIPQPLAEEVAELRIRLAGLLCLVGALHPPRRWFVRRQIRRRIVDLAVMEARLASQVDRYVQAELELMSLEVW